jgi:hypothetical protein
VDEIELRRRRRAAVATEGRPAVARRSQGRSAGGDPVDDVGVGLRDEHGAVPQHGEPAWMIGRRLCRDRAALDGKAGACGRNSRRSDDEDDE